MSMKNSLLFVCVGNTCRSAIASGIVMHRWPHLAIRSAGIRAPASPKPAADEAIAVMRAWKIDLSAHQTTRLDELDLQEFNQFVAMDESVLPELLKKGVARLHIHELIVDDPFAHELGAYEECADKIGNDLAKLARKLGW